MGGRFKKQAFPYVRKTLLGSLTKMKTVVFALFSLLVGHVLCNIDEHLETVLAVTQCRASCLDQFSHLIRTEDNCDKDLNCMMTPGCQKACSFGQTQKNESALLAPTLLRSVYQPHMDRVGLERVPYHDLESKGTVLYAVLLKENNQKWYQVTQTTSHVVHIKRGLLNRNTLIRVLASNATTKVLDSETSYLESYITHASSHGTKMHESKFWKPHLESMVQSELIVGLMTTITWPEQIYKLEKTLYEVSWNVIDDTIEITGHLHTSSNAAILTLWPNSLYSVQVNSYTSGKHLHSQSEPLIIDTRNSYKETVSSVMCNAGAGEKTAVNAFAFLMAFFLTFLIFAFMWAFKRRKEQLVDGCSFEDPEPCRSTETLQIKIQKENAVSQRNNLVNEQETKENLHYIPPVEIKSEIFHTV